MDKWYLVNLRLILGSYEKQSKHLIEAQDEKSAGILALENECHDEPDFSEFPEKDSCWDVGEFIYQVNWVKEITPGQARIYDDLTGITYGELCDIGEDPEEEHF